MNSERLIPGHPVWCAIHGGYFCSCLYVPKGLGGRATDVRDLSEQPLAGGWDAETVKRQVADFNALCDAARGYRERAEQAEQERDRLREWQRRAEAELNTYRGIA
jgi:hypothetical protein